MGRVDEAEGEIEAALGIACLVGVGSSPLLSLLREYKPSQIWRASLIRLQRMGVSRAVAERFVAKRRGWSTEQVRERMAETGTRFVHLSQLGPSVRSLAFPPVGLFVLGPEAVLEEMLAGPRVTVVGTRRATPYGRAIARAAGGRMAAAGVTVVSGLAFGIDVEAHRGTLAAGGLTAAVLGCGPNVVYPRLHTRVYEDIRSQGVIISEYPPDTPPAPWRFPARNRIMAALGQALLVVEAGGKSGATITVDEALSLGRSVIVAPGPLGSEASRGCHRLIAEGAVILESLDDLVQGYLELTRTERGVGETGRGRRPANPPPGEAGVGGAIGRLATQALSQGPRSVDQLAAAAGCSVREMSAALALMELRGEITRAGIGVYSAAT